MDKSILATLAISVSLASAPAVAQTVVVNPPPQSPQTVVVKPQPKPSTIVVTPTPKEECDTTVVKKEGPVKDTTKITKEC